MTLAGDPVEVANRRAAQAKAPRADGRDAPSRRGCHPRGRSLQGGNRAGRGPRHGFIARGGLETPPARPPTKGRAGTTPKSREQSFGAEFRGSLRTTLTPRRSTTQDHSVRRRGLEPDQVPPDPSLCAGIRRDRDPRIATDSDTKCAIGPRAVTIGDDSFPASSARPEWDRALHHALVARATELASTLPADAVERALLGALSTAKAEGRWADVAALAHDLVARRRVRAATANLGAERARRSGGPG